MNAPRQYNIFDTIVTGAGIDEAAVFEAARQDSINKQARRIASTLFTTPDIHPSIVWFAEQRVAWLWGIDIEDFDARVASALIARCAELTRTIYDLEARVAA